MAGRQRRELAARRRVQGHTQESLARRLRVDVSTVARWERGQVTPSPSLRRALAEVLAVSMERLDGLLDGTGPAAREPGTADDGPESARRWLTDFDRRELPSGAEELDGRWPSIGAETVERAAARVWRLRLADDVLAGGDLYRVVRAELAETLGLLRAARNDDEVRRRLLAVVADLCQLAGWSTADAGHETAARQHYRQGVRAAREAEDPVLTAHLLSSLAYHVAESGVGVAQAVPLARAALDRLDGTATTPTVSALLSARLAWAYAANGALGPAAATMDRSREFYASRRTGDPDPEWTYWLTPEQMDIIVGRCDTALNRPERAAPLLRNALRGCDPRHLRESVLYTVWLAHARLGLGDRAEATRLADAARRGNDAIRSGFGTRAVRRLVHRLHTG